MIQAIVIIKIATDAGLLMMFEAIKILKKSVSVLVIILFFEIVFSRLV